MSEWAFPRSLILLVLTTVATGCGKSPSNPIVPQPLDPPTTVYDRIPAWSPTRAEIAYVHIARNLDELARGRYQIWLYDAVAETSSYQAAGFNPAWSPDGDSILFVADQRALAIGRVTHAVTELAAFGDIKDVAWSPTAQMLTITSDYGLLGGYHIFLVSLSGGLPKDISTLNNEGAWHQPRFNPAGDRLVHERFLQNTIGTELFVMDTTGANALRLTTNPTYDTDGAWSPDGAHIAYSHDTELWMVNADGSNNHRVIEGAFEPSWSPDGQRLVVTRIVSTGPSLWIIAPDGSMLTPLQGLP